MSNIVFKVKDQVIEPAPMLKSVSTENYESDDGQVFGCKNILSFEGFFLAETGGITALFNKIEEYKSLFNCCGLLEITCGGQTIFLEEAFFREFAIEDDENNFTQYFSFSFQAEYMNTGECCSLGLTEKSDSWSVTEEKDCNMFDLEGFTKQCRRFMVTHNVSAAAMRDCGGRNGWEIAKDAVEEMLEVDFEVIQSSLLGNGCLQEANILNRVRVLDIDKMGGSVRVDETFLVTTDTGAAAYVKEDCTVDINRESSSRIASVNISGTIDGYEVVTYNSGCLDIEKTKIESAQDYFDLIKDDLHLRAQNISGITLNVVPVSSNYTVSPCAGRISYNYSYSNNLICYYTGECDAIKEDLTISGSEPTDKYAEFNILGRSCVLLQNLNMKTKGTKTIDYSLVLDCGEDCISDIDNLLGPPDIDGVNAIIEDIFNSLSSKYDVIYTDQDSYSWDPKTGSYRKTVSFSYSSCCTGI